MLVKRTTIPLLIIVAFVVGCDQGGPTAQGTACVPTVDRPCLTAFSDSGEPTLLKATFQYGETVRFLGRRAENGSPIGLDYISVETPEGNGLLTFDTHGRLLSVSEPLGGYLVVQWEGDDVKSVMVRAFDGSIIDLSTTAFRQKLTESTVQSGPSLNASATLKARQLAASDLIDSLHTEKTRIHVRVTDCSGTIIPNLNGRIKVTVDVARLFNSFSFSLYPTFDGDEYVASYPRGPSAGEAADAACEYIVNFLEDPCKYVEFLSAICESGPDQGYGDLRLIGLCRITKLIRGVCLGPPVGPGGPSNLELVCAQAENLIEMNPQIPPLPMSISCYATASFDTCDGSLNERPSITVPVAISDDDVYLNIDGCDSSPRFFFGLNGSTEDTTFMVYNTSAAVISANQNPPLRMFSFSSPIEFSWSSLVSCGRPSNSNPVESIDTSRSGYLHLSGGVSAASPMSFGATCLIKQEFDRSRRSIRTPSQVEQGQLDANPDLCVRSLHQQSAGFSATHIVSLLPHEKLVIDADFVHNGPNPHRAVAIASVIIVYPALGAFNIFECDPLPGMQECTNIGAGRSHPVILGYDEIALASSSPYSLPTIPLNSNNDGPPSPFGNSIPAPVSGQLCKKVVVRLQCTITSGIDDLGIVDNGHAIKWSLDIVR